MERRDRSSDHTRPARWGGRRARHVHGHAGAARGAPSRGSRRAVLGRLSMMDLRIAHLYPDLMNIYGDRGNVIALAQRAKWRGIQVEVRPYSVGEWAEPEWPDVWFFGGGQGQGQDIVGADLAGKNGTALSKSVSRGAGIFAVCGGDH